MSRLIVWGLNTHGSSYKPRFASSAAYAICKNWKEFANLPCDATYLPQTILYKFLGPERINEGGLIKINKELREKYNLPRFVITGRRLRGEQESLFESLRPFEQTQWFARDLFESLQRLPLDNGIVFNVWGSFFSPSTDYSALIEDLNQYDIMSSKREFIKTTFLSDDIFNTLKLTLNYDSFGSVLHYPKDIDIYSFLNGAYLRNQTSN